MVIKRHICPKCLKNYKRSGDGIRARKNIKKNNKFFYSTEKQTYMLAG